MSENFLLNLCTSIQCTYLCWKISLFIFESRLQSRCRRVSCKIVFLKLQNVGDGYNFHVAFFVFNTKSKVTNIIDNMKSMTNNYNYLNTHFFFLWELNSEFFLAEKQMFMFINT